MAKITQVKLGHRKWTEDGKNFFEPVLRVRRDDETKTDYIFCHAKFDQLLPLEEGLVVMISRKFVWSSVQKSTIVERYVIQAQLADDEPMVFQSFRLFPIEKGKKPRPSRWMWNNGPLEEQYANEKEADEPFVSRRKWIKGPQTNCEVLKDPDRPPERPPIADKRKGRGSGSGGPTFEVKRKKRRSSRRDF